MSYLIQADYNRQIQTTNLNQITTADPTVQYAAERAAQAEITSYLAQRFDTSQEFKDTSLWSPALTYNPADRVYVNYPAYVNTNTYNINDLCTNGGNAYICTVNGSTGAFQQGNWTLIGVASNIYFAKYPQLLFQYSNTYKTGDQVFWNGRTYTAKQNTVILDQDTALQYEKITNIPLANIAPDDPVSGASYWTPGATYNVPAGAANQPNNATYWTLGDNRDQMIVMYYIDIVLYHIHSRISPLNVPKLREDRYYAALDHLKGAARGEFTFALPKLQPTKGARIRYGGRVKNINSY